MAKTPVKAATRVYVVGSCPILLDGDLYLPGEEIALTEPQAARLRLKAAVSAAAVEPIPLPE